MQDTHIRVSAFRMVRFRRFLWIDIPFCPAAIATCRHEEEGRRVNTVAFTAGGWSVVKEVAEVRSARCASDLDALHRVRIIVMQRYGFAVNRGKSRPPASGVEFVFRIKE